LGGPEQARTHFKRGDNHDRGLGCRFFPILLVGMCPLANRLTCDDPVKVGSDRKHKRVSCARFKPRLKNEDLPRKRSACALKPNCFQLARFGPQGTVRPKPVSEKIEGNWNLGSACNFLFAAQYEFGVGDMHGSINAGKADQEALVVLVTTPRPIGLTPKRVIDIGLALSALALLAPLFVICSVVTACSSRGPVLFRHKRVGFNGKQFDCLKFRTMTIDATEHLRRHLEADSAAAAEWLATRKLRNDPRVTPIGSILRKSSLDELPQLFNVLKGEMSIVGPRPLTEEELSRYSFATTAYYACRPGITGLWQVSGRSTTTFNRRIVLDKYYASHWSISLDVKIMVATIPAVCFSDTAY
jgi:exopolysaccharide production protein ExoY